MAIYPFFAQWQPWAILDSYEAYWDHPQVVLGGLCHNAEFGWNRDSSFDNMKVLIICTFGLKMPIHIPK